ncbi:MAG TPA: hypothetical protein VK364_08210, partial [Hymenobacter sp.]|nr:hypothetical protein [Hymenobacter sp.]
MKSYPLFVTLLYLILLISTSNVSAQDQSNKTPFLFGDLLPDAPELAARGAYKVGVRTLKLVHPAQIDVLHPKDGKSPLYDRPLTVEVWYPARIPAGKS